MKLLLATAYILFTSVYGEEVNSTRVVSAERAVNVDFNIFRTVASENKIDLDFSKFNNPKEAYTTASKEAVQIYSTNKECLNDFNMNIETEATKCSGSIVLNEKLFHNIRAALSIWAERQSKRNDKFKSGWDKISDLIYNGMIGYLKAQFKETIRFSELKSLIAQFIGETKDNLTYYSIPKDADDALVEKVGKRSVQLFNLIMYIKNHPKKSEEWRSTLAGALKENNKDVIRQVFDEVKAVERTLKTVKYNPSNDKEQS